LQRHLKQLEERACADEGMEASAEEVAKLAVVPMGVVMAVSGDDIDPGTQT
jgi:DNA polymerase I-like protein with 3'-5' exonuclease and polymerase domains